MGTDDRGSDGNITPNEKSDSLIEDSCQQMNESPSELSLNFNYSTLNDIKDFEQHDLSKIRGIVNKAKKTKLVTLEFILYYLGENYVR